MRVHPECIPCIIKVRFKEISQHVSDRRKMLEAFSEILRIVAKYVERDKPNPVIAMHAFRYVKKVTGLDDPYLDYRRRANEYALKFLPYARKFIEEADDSYERFRRACIISCLGNLVDPGVAGYTFKPKLWVEMLKRSSFKLDDTGKAFKLIRWKHVLLICDNSGEIVFDRLLVEILKENGCNVTVAVRSGAFQNDALMVDAIEAGLNEVADKVVETGSDAPGFIPWEVSKTFLREVKNVDFVLSKGMANYETIPEYFDYIRKPVLFLLVAKCRPIADSLGVDEGDLVAWLLE